MTKSSALRAVLLSAAALLLAGCNPFFPQPVGNTKVPEPRLGVDLQKYLGKWHELARYEASFQVGCEAVTAEYSLRDDGMVKVLNSCHQDTPAGTLRSAEGKAKIVDGANGAKLKVSFFGPFYGDYWVLDRAADYSWSIVGEPSGKYLWLLSRNAPVSEEQYQAHVKRIAELGYDVKLLRRTKW